MADMESTLDLERFGVPISNKENKKLEAVVKEKEKEILNRQNNVDLYRDRIEAITGHLKNVKQELGHTLVRKLWNIFVECYNNELLASLYCLAQKIMLKSVVHLDCHTCVL